MLVLKPNLTFSFPAPHPPMDSIGAHLKMFLASPIGHALGQVQWRGAKGIFCPYPGTTHCRDKS